MGVVNFYYKQKERIRFYFLVFILVALLSGARNQKNSKLAQEVVDRIRMLFPDVKGSLLPASILLANTYASSGDIEKATNIKIELHKSG
ncbi:unnamed protein product, partial [Rotaria magnacalcarata]